MNLVLKENNYIFLKNLIEPERANHLANLFIEFSKRNGVKGDTQAPNSPSFHNFMPFVKLLVELTPKLSEIAGESLLPTYAYSRVYSHGEVLARHTDRPACEVSVTLNLSKDTDWPIFFKKPNGTEVSVNFEPGDGAIYLGYDAEHWRDAFEGKEYVQVFLHYVRADGRFQWAYFDKGNR